MNGASDKGESIQITIPPGFAASQTADLLKKHDIIRSKFLFRIVAKVTGADRKIKPGTYSFRRNMSLLKVMSTLKRGTNNDVRISIPEGFSARQIAERLEANGLTKAKDFMKIVK